MLRSEDSQSYLRNTELSILSWTCIRHDADGKEMDTLRQAILATIALSLCSSGCTIMSDRALADLERRAIADSVRASLQDYKAVLDSDDAFQILYYYKDHPSFDRIELEVTQQYSVSFFRNGRARLINSSKYFWWIGKCTGQTTGTFGTFTGEIGWNAFARLSYLFDKLQFLSMRERSRGNSGSLDSPWDVLRVWPVGEAEPITVGHQNSEGPIEFWALQRIVEREADTIIWKPEDR
jgi:hypothetical protein